MTTTLRATIALVAMLAATAQAQKSAVLGIDLGSQFFKVRRAPVALLEPHASPTLWRP